MKKASFSVRLTESAVMLALAVILSMLKLVDLPYGGSITLISMLPILLISYRYGVLWGLLTGFVYGIIQLILGAGTLSYATSAAAAAAIIIFDYLLAFAAIGCSGLVRSLFRQQNKSLAAGAVLAGALRYLCHVVSGCTVWAGLSIPTAGALVFSLVYNATYMLPETLVLVFAAYYMGSVLDFNAHPLKALAREAAHRSAGAPKAICGAVSLAAGIFDVVSIFAKLQNADTGEFDITGIAAVNWTAVLTVTGAAIILCIAVCAIWRMKDKKSAKI